MSELPLPSYRRLPDDVRDRALQKILTGIAAEDGPGQEAGPGQDEYPGTGRDEVPNVAGPRRPWWAAAAAAAAVVVALLTITLAVRPTGPVAQGVPGVVERPNRSVDPIVDLAVTRCAAAVVAQGRTADYPPITTWRATATLTRSSENVGAPAQPDIAVAVSDAFVCFAGASEVQVSAVSGTRAGDVQLTRIGPTVLVALLNPKRRTVTLDPGTIEPIDATAPVQLLSLPGDASAFHLTVQGSFDGPMPEPAQGGITASDRPSISREPVPPGTGSLEACLAGAMPGERVALRHPGVPSAAAAVRSDGTFAGFCVTGQSGSGFEGGGLPPIEGRNEPTVVAEIGGREPEIFAVLIAVPADTKSAVIAPAPVPDLPIQPVPTECSVGAGLALCTLNAPGPVRVVVVAPSGATAVVLLE